MDMARMRLLITEESSERPRGRGEVREVEGEEMVGEQK
jgi:hypothetical protein